jgi:hypothetical protein
MLRVPPITQIRWYSAPFLALLIFFAVYYRWTVQPALRVEIPEHGLYNRLTDSFLAGQLSLLAQPDPGLLQLPDPYDPKENEPYRVPGVHDMSLYEGKFYAYFGPAAALTLFLPFRLFGIALPDRVGLAIFATGAFVASCLLLKVAIAYFYPQTPAFLFYALCGVLGFSNTFPVLLRRPDMYEIAIASGQFFLFSGLYLITRSALDIESSNKTAWFGGAMLGMAVLARPPLIFAGLALVWLWCSRRALIRPRQMRALAAAVPIAAAVAVSCAYNYARFDSPLDFGIRHQLAGIDSTKIVFFSLPRLTGNTYLFLLYPPDLSAAFPFLSLSRPWLPPAGRYLLFEPIGGLIWLSPLLLTLLLAPWVIYKEQGERRRLLAWFTGVPFFIAIALLCLDSSLVATMRYTADFASLLFVAAALTIAGLWQMSKPGAWRILYTVVFVIFGLASVGSNAAIGLMGYLGGLNQSAPDQYRALEKIFKPASKVLQVLGVKP